MSSKEGQMANIDDEFEFRKRRENEISQQGKSEEIHSKTKEWLNESIKTNYSYHFDWLGRPIIQYPQDMLAVQQLLWSIKPDLVIETGIARGGSLIYYASILELISQCGGPADARVLGIDIDVRAHNKEAILAHPMSKRIGILEGSSIDPAVTEIVLKRAQAAKTVLVCLDSNHTHDHVLEELRVYGPMVSVGSYCIVFDTIIEDLPAHLIGDRPWSKGNNPRSAVETYLDELKSWAAATMDPGAPEFIVDEAILNQILISVAPSGYLQRLK